jgi:hypothetical protein
MKIEYKYGDNVGIFYGGKDYGCGIVTNTDVTCAKLNDEHHPMILYEVDVSGVRTMVIQCQLISYDDYRVYRKHTYESWMELGFELFR